MGAKREMPWEKERELPIGERSSPPATARRRGLSGIADEEAVAAGAAPVSKLLLLAGLETRRGERGMPRSHTASLLGEGGGAATAGTARGAWVVKGPLPLLLSRKKVSSRPGLLLLPVARGLGGGGAWDEDTLRGLGGGACDEEELKSPPSI